MKPSNRRLVPKTLAPIWQVTSCAFLGGKVRGNKQFGRVGEASLMAIPILPDGSLDPAYDPVTGKLRQGQTLHAQSFIPNHGEVDATSLLLSGLDPAGNGSNQHPPLRFIVEGT
jgi:hypothetical protein